MQKCAKKVKSCTQLCNWIYVTLQYIFIWETHFAVALKTMAHLHDDAITWIKVCTIPLIQKNRMERSLNKNVRWGFTLWQHLRPYQDVVTFWCCKDVKTPTTNQLPMRSVMTDYRFTITCPKTLGPGTFQISEFFEFRHGRFFPFKKKIDNTLQGPPLGPC